MLNEVSRLKTSRAPDVCAYKPCTIADNIQCCRNFSKGSHSVSFIAPGCSHITEWNIYELGWRLWSRPKTVVNSFGWWFRYVTPLKSSVNNNDIFKNRDNLTSLCSVQDFYMKYEHLCHDAVVSEEKRGRKAKYDGPRFYANCKPQPTDYLAKV